MDILTTKSLILFDGVCNFCNSSVNFVIDRDVHDHFIFASLQSPLGLSILKKFNRPQSDFDSIILVTNNLIYEKSTAALMIAKNLKFPWNCMSVFLIIPTFVRDPIYSLIARNRYRLFGRREFCRIPTPEEKHKILS